MLNDDDFLVCRSCGMILLDDRHEQCVSCRYGILEEDEMCGDDINPYAYDDLEFTMTTIEKLRWQAALGNRIIRWKIRWFFRSIIHKIKYLMSEKYRDECCDGIPF